MEKMKLSIEIKAPKDRVWNTLWEDKTFREWASSIDEGTYMHGVMEEGDEVEFISSLGGYGVTSLVEKLIPSEFVMFRHSADTREAGKMKREREWTGGTESYSLAERDSVTTLTTEFDVPPGQEETFRNRLPKALARVKTLAEKAQEGQSH